MELTVRHAFPSDLPKVADHYGHEDTPWDPFGSVERLKNIPIEGLLIAEVEREYAGFLYWYEGHNPYFMPGLERFANLEELHVRKEFRRRGVAKSLISRFIADARELGIEQLFVDTDDDNVAAQRLYESFGFRKYREVYFYGLK